MTEQPSHPIRPWIGDPPRTEPPSLPGYVELSRERLNMGPLTVVGFVLIPLWWFIIVALVAVVGGPTEFSFSIGLLALVYAALIALVAVPVFHELVHGIAGMLVGVKPAYGVGAGFAYTTFREPLGKWQYLAVGLAPLAVLTVLSVLVAARWEAIAPAAVFFAVINAAGAIGDLWMSWRILRAPRSAIFYDLADGFSVLVPEGVTRAG